MVRAATALLAGLTLAFGVAACGGGDSDVSDVAPKTIPDLIAPKDASLPEVTATTGTTTGDTATTPQASDTPAATDTPTTTPQSTATTDGTSGGTGATTTTPSANNNGSEEGGFSPFCADNAEAC